MDSYTAGAIFISPTKSPGRPAGSDRNGGTRRIRDMPYQTTAHAAPDATTRLAWTLASAGVLPFLAGLADLVLGDGAWTAYVQVYAAVIASFICGIHWGAALLGKEARPVMLLIASNVAALLAWVAALAPASTGFFIFAALFLGLAWIDGQLHRSGAWPAWFWLLRLTISAIVATICLLIGVMA